MSSIQTRISNYTDFNVLLGLETIKLIEQLQHSSLDLRVATRAALDTSGSNRVDLVHEDNRRRVLTSHHEQLSDHPRTLTDELLHELTARDTNERALGVMSDGASKKRLASTGRTVEKHTLRLCNSECFEQLGVLNGKLNDLLDLLDLLVETSHHLVCRVGNLLDHHERHERVDFVRQDLVKQVAVVLERHARVRCHLRHVDVLVHVDDEFTFWVHFNEHFLLVHGLDDLAHV